MIDARIFRRFRTLCRRYGMEMVVLLLCALLSAAGARAAGPPDAGTLLRDVEKTAPPARPEAPPELPAAAEVPPPVVASGGATFVVSRFEFSGQKSFPAQLLQQQLTDYIGRRVDFAGLQQAAARVTAFYRAHGLITSRAYLPEQQIEGGVVKIAIREGTLAPAGIKLQPTPSVRLRSGFAHALLSRAIPEGQVLRRQNLERGLLLLNDLPGINAASTLAPGSVPGSSELQVELRERRLVTGSLEADNYGNRYTGSTRGGGSLQLNDAAGIGDQAVLRYLTSGGGLSYLRGGYEVPLGPSGARFDVHYTWMNYELGKQFKDDNIDGRTSIAGATLKLPLVRSRTRNLSLFADYDRKQLKGTTLGVTTSDRQLDVFRFAVAGDRVDRLYRTGVTSYRLGYSCGELDLGALPDVALIDSATARSDGPFHHLNLDLSHTRYLPHHLSLLVHGQFQYAFDNLDDSEKLALGGPTGVRAWPQGEANGDSGMILTAELHYDLPPLLPEQRLQASLFVDHGRTTLNHQTWAGWQGSNPGLENHYGLSGVGIGLTLAQDAHYYLGASYAWKLGNNKGRDVSGNDSNGRNDPGQFWLQGVYWF